MTDLEMTKLCAEALRGDDKSITITSSGGHIWAQTPRKFDPLNDDLCAMALDGYIMEQRYCISMDREECEIYPLENYKQNKSVFSFHLDFTKPENRRRVRVECVAKIQAAK